MTEEKQESEAISDRNRRAFLNKCGRFAAVTPPVMALMLSASKSDPALAGSGFDSGSWGHPNNGFGNGGGDGVPGNSGKSDENR